MPGSDACVGGQRVLHRKDGIDGQAQTTFSDEAGEHVVVVAVGHDAGHDEAARDAAKPDGLAAELDGGQDYGGDGAKPAAEPALGRREATDVDEGAIGGEVVGRVDIEAGDAGAVEDGVERAVSVGAGEERGEVDGGVVDELRVRVVSNKGGKDKKLPHLHPVL